MFQEKKLKVFYIAGNAILLGYVDTTSSGVIRGSGILSKKDQFIYAVCTLNSSVEWGRPIVMQGRTLGRIMGRGGSGNMNYMN